MISISLPSQVVDVERVQRPKLLDVKPVVPYIPHNNASTVRCGALLAYTAHLCYENRSQKGGT
jgi:hypothetical protein